MNTNHINNRKAEFVLAMKENNRDLYRAITPAEMMALLHNCDPVHYEEGIDIILDNTDASEDMLMEYIDSNYCWEHDWLNVILKVDPSPAESADYISIFFYNCLFRSYSPLLLLSLAV